MSTTPTGTVAIHPLHGIPEVQPHHDLGTLLRTAMERAGLSLQGGDVLVVSSKVVSKAWGLRCADTDRDGVVRSQSRRVVAERRSPVGTTRVVESLAGPVLAAAGVDASNTGDRGGLLLLPDDPDLAARALYAGLLTAYAPRTLPEIGIVLSDTAGRPWREGQTDFALGACGVAVLDDLRGGRDADGRPLSVTARAVADEVAAAADLVKGKHGAVPAALVRGLPAGTTTDPGAPGAAHLVRTGPGDWFGLGALEAIRSALGAPPGSRAADAVGVASVAPEAVAVRLGRAVALALAGMPGGAADVEVTSGEGPLVVHCADDYLRGRATARLEVALHAEGLSHLEVS